MQKNIVANFPSFLADFLLMSMVLMFASCGSQSGSSINEQTPCLKPTTIVLVRHAEKVDESKDPELSESGKLRAEKLAKMFSGWHIDHFYSTPYIRTQNTLMPLALLSNSPISAYSVDTLYDFAAMLRSIPDARIFVSGHSNSTPQLINYLIETEVYTDLDDSEYGKIFFVTICDGVPLDHYFLKY